MSSANPYIPNFLERNIMATDLLKRNKKETIRRRKKEVSGKERKKLSGDALISFISGCQTNIGRSTYYNLATEQKAVMNGQHKAVFECSRLFYSLMLLPKGVTDVNKHLISLNLIKNTLRDSKLKSHEHDPVTRWENELMLQILSNMPIPRVFDFFMDLQDNKITNKRTKKIIKRFFMEHTKQLGMWTLKYREQVKRIFRHINVTPKSPKLWTCINTYIRKGEITKGTPDIIAYYEAVRNKTLPENYRLEQLAKLPYTVAEGFKDTFGLTKTKFDKMFIQQGGKLTNKEKVQKTNALTKSGVKKKDIGVDINKLSLFDLLVYIHSQKKMSETKTELKRLIKNKAEIIASTMSFRLNKVGLILDTSISMYGNDTEKFHPLLKGMAISAIIKEASNGFKEYRTNPSTSLIPKITDKSNYADSVLQALKDGCETIVLVGDGYENSPYEGALHNLLYTYKQRLDKENKLLVLHLNPVFASESRDVRAISTLAPQIGVKGIEGINESMFLAIAKDKPLDAIEGYARHLLKLQSPKAKALMPEALKKFAENKSKKLLV